jgi:hypothetical protein
MKPMAITLLILLITACSPKDPLDGPIPECKELLSQEKKGYVDLATERCDQARTMQEKMSSVGCVIKDKWQQCDSRRILRGSKSAFDK